MLGNIIQSMAIRHGRILPFKFFGFTKLHKKGSRNIFLLINRVIPIFSIALVCTKQYLTWKVSITKAVLENWP